MFEKKKQSQIETSKFDGVLSKDLPGGRVRVPEGSEKKSYYKYYLEPMSGYPTESLKAEIKSRNFSAGQGLEAKDRCKLQLEDPYPAIDGVYPLKAGGVMTCANVKVPDMTGEMFAWWADWHGLDPLRYAIWDPEDHYDLKIIKNRERLLDTSIPIGEKIIGTKHAILESFDKDAPASLSMEFVSPWDCGYDKSLAGTDRHMYMICAKADMMNGKIPVFASEVLVKGKDGVNEIRSRFWIGYELQPDGSLVCKIPKFIKPPKKIVEQLVIHNLKEFTRLNEILPRIYEEEKDNL